MGESIPVPIFVIRLRRPLGTKVGKQFGLKNKGGALIFQKSVDNNSFLPRLKSLLLNGVQYCLGSGKTGRRKQRTPSRCGARRTRGLLERQKWCDKAVAGEGGKCSVMFDQGDP